MDRARQKTLLNQHGIRLDPLEIHGKDFKVRMRGYDKDEVDDFLDEIIRDYEKMVHLIESWSHQTSMQSAKLDNSETAPFAKTGADKEEHSSYTASLSISKDEITMLKVRLANLERKVFGKSRSES